MRFAAAALQDRRGAAALEFALVAVPAIAFLLFILELSFDLFSQAVLDDALQLAARQIQTGGAQNAKNGGDFIANYLCPDFAGLLSCNGLYVKVQRLALGSTQDYYNYTTGVPPVTAGVLDLSSYNSASFCNSGPSQLLLISAVYVGPTLIGNLVPNALAVFYNGSRVHATFSTVGIVSEGYPASAAASGAASPC